MSDCPPMKAKAPARRCPRARDERKRRAGLRVSLQLHPTRTVPFLFAGCQIRDAWAGLEHTCPQASSPSWPGLARGDARHCSPRRVRHGSSFAVTRRRVPALFRIGHELAACIITGYAARAGRRGVHCLKHRPSHPPLGSASRKTRLTVHTVSRWDRILVFGGLNLAALALFVVCFTLLPILSLRPRKFAILYVSILPSFRPFPSLGCFLSCLLSLMVCMPSYCLLRSWMHTSSALYHILRALATRPRPSMEDHGLATGLHTLWKCPPDHKARGACSLPLQLVCPSLVYFLSTL